MYNSETISFVKIEEELNELLRNEKIRKLRTALVDFITERLRERVLVRLEETGFDAELKQGYLADDTAKTDAFYQLLQENREFLGISQKQMRELKRNAKASRECGWDYLLDIQLEEEILRFRKEAGIAAKVWLSFRNHTVLPGEATLEKLRSHLSLTAEQFLEFDRRVIRYVFWVDHALREQVHKLRKETGMSLSDFLNYAFIGKEAWEAFYPLEDESFREKKTSQETLLKLVIGFDLNETAAWQFMDIAKSAFVVRRDLVVLSCIRCEYSDPIQVQEILEFFAEGRNGERYYTNPYR